MPHFTERCRAGSVLAAKASTRSAMERCACGKLLMDAKTGLSPTAEARGMGLGRRLSRELERHARAGGASVVRLETNRALKEAIQLYRSSGYREVAAFNDEPYAHHWFQKRIRRGAAPAMDPARANSTRARRSSSRETS